MPALASFNKRHPCSPASFGNEILYRASFCYFPCWMLPSFWLQEVSIRQVKYFNAVSNIAVLSFFSTKQCFLTWQF